MLRSIERIPHHKPDIGEQNADPGHDLRLIRETQHVRVHQSHRALPLVLGTGLIYIIALWDEAPRLNLVVWTSLILASAILRVVVCRYIEQRVETASLDQLNRFERGLFWTSILSTSLVGSGFWWVCLEGSDTAVFAVTLLCCIYAIGTTVNSSVQFKGFPTLLVTNLGQGILFISGVGGEPQLAVAAALSAILLLLIGFGRENSRIFSESIQIRAENVALVGQLNDEKKTVEQALASAREANDAKSRFLAAASHDLRQPLHAISLFLGSLSPLVTGDTAKQIMQRTNETLNVLKEQFDGLLDLSRFDAGGVQVDLSEFQIDTLLQRVIEGERPDAEQKDLRLDLDASPVMVYSDALLIERVINNLVSNAIRYTEKGSISVSAKVEDGAVHVSVTDTGPGIAAPDRKRIFEDFAQLHNPGRRRDQGTGLGLAIVRRIDQLLGLSLLVSSKPGVGSKFDFQLPLSSAHATSSPAPARQKSEVEPAGQYDGFRVWAVEDDRDVGEALTMQLQSWGCDVILTSSRSGVERAYKKSSTWPDLILIDDMLGTEESGLDLARWMNEHVPRERIVMITGNVDLSRLRQLRNSDFQILQKPTSPDDLRRIIAVLYDKKHLSQVG